MFLPVRFIPDGAGTLYGEAIRAGFDLDEGTHFPQPGGMEIVN